jgi:hypothetical protein
VRLIALGVAGSVGWAHRKQKVPESIAMSIETLSNSPLTPKESVDNLGLKFTRPKAPWHSIIDDDEYLDFLLNAETPTRVVSASATATVSDLSMLESLSPGKFTSSDEDNSSDDNEKNNTSDENDKDDNRDEGHVDGDVVVQGAVDGFSGKTTVMIQGIPRTYMPEQVRKEIDNLGFVGLYDFFYLPRARGANRFINRGCAFTNFLTSEHAKAFSQSMHGRTLEAGNESFIVEVMPAEIQGFENNARRFGEAGGSRNKIKKEVFMARPVPSARSGSFEQAVYATIPMVYAFNASCGQHLMTGNDWCPNCGAAKMVGNANFCHACGGRFPYK